MDEIGAAEIERVVEQLAAAVPPGGRIALADGAGFPHEAWPAVVELSLRRPDVQVLLGWCVSTPARIEELDGGRVRAVVSGFGLRRAIDAGHVGYLPVRLGTMGARLTGPLRPDVLLTTLRPAGGGLAFSTEIGWQRQAIASGASVFAVLRPGAPATDSGDPLTTAEVTVVAESRRAPDELPPASPSDTQREIGARIAALLPEGARLQVGPGGLGVAVFDALTRPVVVDTGIVSDSVVDLAERGLVDGPPLTPYVVGTERVYDWCAGRVQVRGAELTHDPGRLKSGRPFVAVNTGLEIDLSGQVNAEGVAGSAVGTIGGQPDFAAGAAASPSGLSIIALATRTSRGVPTLVRSLQLPATTPSHDVDIVVTERGVADLRGLTRAERSAALLALWDGVGE